MIVFLIGFLILVAFFWHIGASASRQRKILNELRRQGDEKYIAEHGDPRNEFQKFFNGISSANPAPVLSRNAAGWSDLKRDYPRSHGGTYPRSAIAA
jgi:hypothetical protein